MNIKHLIVFALTACLARADYSCIMTQKGGPMAGAPNITKTYIKGQKMKSDSGNVSTIFDMDAQTMTTINTAQKTYTVAKFSELANSAVTNSTDISASFKETGQRKTINGFNASEIQMTMDFDSPQLKQQGIKMTMEMSIWISPDTPGAAEMKAFQQRNAAKTPWSAMGGQGTAAQMQRAMGDMQKKIASMNGVPVLQVVHIKNSGAAADRAAERAASAQNDPRMIQMRAQLEEMAKKGGPGSDMAKQQLARLGAAPAGGPGGTEIIMEYSGFSTASIPDSVFAIPAGFTQSK